MAYKDMTPKQKEVIKKRTALWKRNNPEKARKQCQNWRQRNPEKVKEYGRLSRIRNYAILKLRATKWRKKYPDKVTNANLKHLYGITLEQYKKMLLKQKGVCEICGGVNKKTKLLVDHDHKTGKIRGLLCIKCNFAIAFLEEDNRINKSVKYLTKYRNK